MKNSSFFKDVLKIASGPLLTQIFGLLTIPIISRLFQPESFGEFAALMAFITPLGVCICFGYESSIILPKKKKDAISLFVLCLFSTFFFTILSVLLAVNYNYFPDLITSKFNPKYFLFAPLFLFFGGVSHSLRYLNMRDKNFGLISSASVISTSLEKVFIISSGFFGNVSSLFLIGGSIVDSIFRPLVYSFKTVNKELFYFISKTKFSDLINLAREYKKFPFYILPTNLFARFSKDIPILLFLFFFSSFEVGLYTFALRILFLPISLLSNSIGEVFFQKESSSKTKSLVFLKQLLKFTFWIGLFPFVILAIFGDQIFELVIGASWKDAGSYSQILSFLVFMRFITSLSSYLAITENKQEYLLSLNIISFVLTTIGITIGGYFNNIYISLGLISFLNGLNYGIIGFRIIKFRGLEFKSVLGLFKKPFLIMLIIAIVLTSFKLVLKLSFPFITLIIILLFIPYFIFFLKENKTFLNIKFNNHILKI